MLSIKLTAGALSEDGTSITLQDTTGLYNAGTNPGGYGSPNPTSASSALCLIQYSIFGGTKNIIVPEIADMIAGKVFTPLTLGLTTDTTKPYLIPDGVNTFEYMVGYSTGVFPGIEGTVIDTTGLTILDGVTFVSFSSNNSKVYEIKDRSVNSITLFEEPEYAIGDTLIVFYSFTAYSLVDTYINKLIDKQVIALNSCNGTEVELFEDVMNLAGAASRYTQKDYLGANTLITTLNRKYEYVSRRVQH